MLLLGLASWALRYLLLAYGNADAGIWMFYLAILLHGNCYDFFFVAGQLYTDQEAPAHLRSSAQGFIAFVTYGIGMYLGSVLSGVARDYFPTWQSFWLSSAIMSAAIMFLVLFFFRSRDDDPCEGEAGHTGAGTCHDAGGWKPRRSAR